MKNNSWKFMVLAMFLCITTALSGCGRDSSSSNSQDVNLEKTANDFHGKDKGKKLDNKLVAFTPVYICGSRSEQITEQDIALAREYRNQIFANGFTIIPEENVTKAYAAGKNVEENFKIMWTVSSKEGMAKLEENQAKLYESIYAMGESLNARYVVMVGLNWKVSHGYKEDTDKLVIVKAFDVLNKSVITQQKYNVSKLVGYDMTNSQAIDAEFTNNRDAYQEIANIMRSGASQ